MTTKQRPRFVFGPDPYEGWLVLLSESSAGRFTEIIETIASSTTMRQFFESMEAIDGSFPIDEYSDEWGDDELDEPFDLESVPGYGDGYFPPDTRTMMIEDLHVRAAGGSDLYEILDGLVTVVDEMGSNPVAVLDETRLDEIRRTLSAAGIDVVGWDAL